MGTIARIASLLLLVSGVASCSSDPEASDVQASAPPSASPASETWTVQEAQDEYEAAVKPGNDNSQRLQDLLEVEEPSAADIASVCDDQSDAEYDLAQFLRDGKWPTEAEEPVSDLISEILNERSSWRACAQAESDRDLVLALTEIGEQDGSAAESVRLALDLPPTQD